MTRGQMYTQSQFSVALICINTVRMFLYPLRSVCGALVTPVTVRFNARDGWSWRRRFLSSLSSFDSHWSWLGRRKYQALDGEVLVQMLERYAKDTLVVTTITLKLVNPIVHPQCNTLSRFSFRNRFTQLWVSAMWDEWEGKTTTWIVWVFERTSG